MEQRVNLKFLVKLRKTCTEVYAMLKEVYGNECLSRTQVFECFKRFKEGRETTKDDPHSGLCEHMAHLKNGRTEKSCVDQHDFGNNRRTYINNLKLIRNVTNSRQWDDFESLEIIKCNSSMNKDNGRIPTSPLFALINKDSYGSVNSGNKFSINSASGSKLVFMGVAEDQNILGRL
ncbi:hypothetical protein NQ318_018635 [Aromia moschata]|uniref:Mos1 transposase HTH domain-containing protein n=1 Tax=Aromia moschata TaxID=1265417 RepID=A0AAV8ZFQ0_9CUCU|nr:hypothetical protein NQ318_018635 [Aromia moschata]